MSSIVMPKRMTRTPAIKLCLDLSFGITEFPI